MRYTFLNTDESSYQLEDYYDGRDTTQQIV